ncbi:Ser/Thr protein phosphatase, putative [Trichomonas vaginalis G3]|uniref:Serine/threonine-protein phosphatase n=1 Tax=Trichomonas vaginalis (strain ATCC PRA-98 / G3) TaxID=412133 RepID=A2FGM6_TRIV3|nr:response to arachidonic acid [Trichomonas vaginalis G3]EAX95950.1 Ser/Thr protein phosphatase, putative [Trichomonas vaginalis G3]KAI5492663.1 response to arachidonic acid [Trichomonas vaginalis G3]|eukprot:XP_001308880.1 Ser/Thr protein phosphatase [Trichomonas vaginalis G3]
MITRPPTPIFSNQILTEISDSSIDGELSQLYSDRAEVFYNLNKIKEAKGDLTSALELDKTNSKAILLQHKIHIKERDTDAAFRDFLFYPTLKEANPTDFKRYLQFHERIAKFAEKINNVTVDLKPKSKVSEGECDFEHFTREDAIDMTKYLRDFNRPKAETVIALIDKIKAILKPLPNIVSINPSSTTGKIRVVGDTHGQFQDLCYIFDQFGYPSADNPYLFNGDYVDRGSMGVEILLTLLCWKVAEPNSIYLNRGNHEAISMNGLYGFERECTVKYSAEMFRRFSDLFCYLPVGHIIGGKVLVVHGGLFGDDATTIQTIQMANRFQQPPEFGAMNDILWSDPMDLFGRAPSPRGVTTMFGPDVTESFLQREKLELLIRSHQMQMEGYLVQHNGKCITVFSSPNYVGRMNNKGAIVTLTFDGNTLKTPEFSSFTAQPIPKDFKPMQYSAFSSYF